MCYAIIWECVFLTEIENKKENENANKVIWDRAMEFIFINLYYYKILYKMEIRLTIAMNVYLHKWNMSINNYYTAEISSFDLSRSNTS